MKNSIPTIVACCLMLSGLRAQTIDNKKSAVKEGDNTINIYYGTNLLSGIYKRLAVESAVDLRVRSLGPIGLVYEHMVSEVVGVGAELGYSQTNLDFHNYDTYYDSQTNQNYADTYNYNMQFTTMRAMFRANFHFADAEKFDAYALVSAGYRTTTFKYTTDNPYDDTHVNFRTLIPVGVKPGIGLRYFFTDNIGLNMEIALGTPLMCGGLSFKF